MAVAIVTEPSLAESSQWRACRLGMGREKEVRAQRGMDFDRAGQRPQEAHRTSETLGGGGDPDRQEGRNGAPRKAN